MTWLCSMRPIHLGDEATRAFTRTVAYTHITSLLAHKTLRAHTPVKLQEGVLHCATGVWQQLEERLPTTGLNKAPLHQPVQEALRLAEYSRIWPRPSACNRRCIKLMTRESACFKSSTHVYYEM